MAHPLYRPLFDQKPVKPKVLDAKGYGGNKDSDWQYTAVNVRFRRADGSKGATTVHTGSEAEAKAKVQALLDAGDDPTMAALNGRL